MHALLERRIGAHGAECRFRLPSDDSTNFSLLSHENFYIESFFRLFYARGKVRLYAVQLRSRFRDDAK
jgi:hypothetical protein